VSILRAFARHGRRRWLTSAVGATVLVLGLGVPVFAAPTSARPDARSQQPLMNPTVGCGQGSYRVTLPGGIKATAEPGCAQIDTARLGQSPPKPARSTKAAAIPSVCPPELTAHVIYHRFEACVYIPLWFVIRVVLPNGDEQLIRIDFTAEMWALLSSQSRTWVVHAVVTPTSITGLGEDGILIATASLACTGDPSCVAAPTLPTDGVLGTAHINTPLAASFAVSDAATSSTINLNDILSVEFRLGGAACDIPPCAPATLRFGLTNPIRCDSQNLQNGYEKGVRVLAGHADMDRQ
jgi:hypothetical protein